MMKSGDVVGFADLNRLQKLPAPEPGKDWFLFTVMAGSEARLAEKIGDTAYYPRRFVWHKFRGRRKLEAPRREKRYHAVLAGYLFYNGQLDDPGIAWIYSDRKVFGVLSKNGVPSRVPNVEIHRMRTAELANSTEVIEVFSLIVGEVVEIVSGQYAGKIGVVRDLEFGKAHLEFPLDRQFANFSVSHLGKISFKP